MLVWRDGVVCALLNDSGRFVLSIDKNQSDTIDIGCRKLKIYPDNPEDIQSGIHAVGLQIIARQEREFAVIYVAIKYSR